MGLSSRLLTHTVTVRPYMGANGLGVVLGDPVEVSCRVEDADELVRNAAGVERTASARIFCDLDVTIPVESEVDVGGRTTVVIKSTAWDTGGRSRLDHREVLVQ